MAPLIGKYRGKVSSNIDPKQMGRLQVVVPAVSEEPLGWAMPCVPYAGDQVGFLTLPPTGANVWVEFEQGNPDYPIWTGCFWGEHEMPAAGKRAPACKILVTDSIQLLINDEAVTLKMTVESDRS